MAGLRGISKKVIINERKACAVCGNHKLVKCLDLPGLPLTGIFVQKRSSHADRGIDQGLLWCPKCSHGQLARQVDPAILYDSGRYAFRTSASATARSGTQDFINFLRTNFSKKHFSCVIDVGCNDLYLLKELKGLVDTRVGIDPIWSSRGMSVQIPGLHVLGKQVEDVDFEADLPLRPDLVLCRHTIEHIHEPALMLEKLIKGASDEAIFIFETPSFSNLLERGRFDQVFHEHLQYFSPVSLEYLLNNLGAEIVAFGENYHDWGAMQVAFRKKLKAKRHCVFSYGMKDIQRKIGLFKDQMLSTQHMLTEFRGKRYGYGAAMMLPVLAYHLNSDLGSFEGIIDDDPCKSGKYYINMPVPIVHSSLVKDLSQHMILVTAVDNIVPIMKKLFVSRPKQIVYPFHSI